MGNEQTTGGEKSHQQQKTTYHPNITIVNPQPASSDTLTQDDNELNKLVAIPKFYPILRSTIHMQNDEQVPHLDYLPTLQLSMRIQQHLKSCSEAVSYDQQTLITRMKEVDVRSNAVTSRLLEKQKRYTYYCDQSKKLRDLVTTVKRLDQTLTELGDKMRLINNALPLEDKLPMLTFRAQVKAE
ncbi:unnamed protein product [Didymodactylos carnosus]|uniref:BLOC-1-related complex subunit 5 n=1 Tax=Didymodactylos carnosus TaxID=1234261 RepID=A0A814EZU3_9BILA|nr:unnamed protein product [Didymodactylos carnosus]CAF0979102.1 unnamed protein product [Didymodactylos carnosus]CAF3648508.1 unnamed protein product [Didymodactylos carnosus]CAF3751799.1 unnamed protein product [Didymodactylos carnosus]